MRRRTACSSKRGSEMTWVWKLVDSSLGKKFLMGLTGFALMGFLVTQLVGYLHVFLGPEAYNGYAAALEHNPLLLPAELGLLLMFVIHIVVAIRLTYGNYRA